MLRHLATPRSLVENFRIGPTLRQGGNQWIGLDDKAVEGDWALADDGTALSLVQRICTPIWVGRLVDPAIRLGSGESLDQETSLHFSWTPVGRLGIVGGVP